MDHVQDDDDLDERLAKVFEERGWAPRPDAGGKPAPAAATLAPVAPAKPATPPIAKVAATSRPPCPAAPPPGRTGRREKTILLGLLGTLVGAFAGVLSLKLFVPRPPAGTGPDVNLEPAAVAPLEVVEPPALVDRRSNLPTSPDPFRALAAAPATTDAAPSPSAFTVEALPEVTPLSAADAPSATGVETRRDLLRADGPADLLPVPGDGQPATVAVAPPARPARDVFAEPSFPGMATAAEVPAGPLGGHVVRTGDSWWSIAEGAYGDGRLYKALVAWNRALDPHTSLAPGTRLDLPEAARLRAAWPRLVPAEGR